MSPTVFRVKSWRFYFFANEELRVRVHLVSPEVEAKFWPELDIDVEIDALEHPERYPLMARIELPRGKRKRFRKVA